MLITFQAALGASVGDLEGIVGSLDDLLFDRVDWHIRYLVITTEWRLRQKHVLLAPATIRRANWPEDRVDLSVHREQIELSPEVGELPELTREREIELAGHFGWEPYWESIVPVVTEEPPRLWRAKDILGYDVSTGSHGVGDVEDLIVDDHAWLIRHFVVDFGSGISGRRVLVATDRVKNIRWDRRQLRLNLTKSQLEHAPLYDPFTPLDGGQNDQLHDLYER